MALMEPAVSAHVPARTRAFARVRARVASTVIAALAVAGFGVADAMTPASAAPSADATLKSFSVLVAKKAQPVFPAFTPTWTQYAVSLQPKQLKIDCKALSVAKGAKIVITPKCAKVKFAANKLATQTLTVTVTAPNKKAKAVYTVTVIHNAPVNAKATLKSVAAAGVKLTPKFNPKKTSFYQVTAKPGTKTIKVKAAGAGKAKAKVLLPKKWQRAGINLVTVNAAAGKAVGSYTIAVLVPQYPTVKYTNTIDIPNGFTTDIVVANGTINPAKLTVALKKGQAADCYTIGNPAITKPKAVAKATVTVSNIKPGCAVTVSTAVTPKLNFLPIAPAAFPKTVTMFAEVEAPLDAPVSVPGGFEQRVKLKVGTTVDASVSLAPLSSSDCINLSWLRLREKGTAAAGAAAQLMATTSPVDTTLQVLGLPKGCQAVITLAVSGNTGYSAPTDPAKRTLTSTGTGGDTTPVLTYSIQRATDGFTATYDAWGGTVQCPISPLQRITVTCNLGAKTVTVAGALPGEEVTLTVPFTTNLAAGFTAPASPFTIVGKALVATATLVAQIDPVTGDYVIEKLAQGFRFNLTVANCTPVVSISSFSPADWEEAYSATYMNPVAAYANGVVTVSGMKANPSFASVDRTADVHIECTPNANFAAPDAIDLTGATLPFNEVFNVKAPSVSIVDIFGTTLQKSSSPLDTLSVVSAQSDWAFPANAILTLSYQWQAGDYSCQNFVNISGKTGDSYMSAELAMDKCVRVVVTPSAKLSGGTIKTGLPMATAGVVTQIKPAYNAVALPQLTSTDIPVIVGSSFITADLGTWKGLAGATISYKWQRCFTASGSNPDAVASADFGLPVAMITAACPEGDWANIDAAKNPTAVLGTFFPTEADMGASVRAVITVANALGTASQASAPLTVPPTKAFAVANPAKAPMSISAPVISAQWNGTAPLTRPLKVVTTGMWQNAAGLSVDWEWQFSANGTTWPQDSNSGYQGTDAQGNTLPNTWGSTPDKGFYRAVEFLVDANGDRVAQVVSNSIQVGL